MSLDPTLAYLQRAAGMRIADIAEDHGVSESTVRAYLKTTDLADKRDRRGRPPATVCRACGLPKEPGALCIPCRQRRARDWWRQNRAATA